MLALFRANYEHNVREILSTIQVPTLVLHRAGDRVVSVEAGRYLADHIPGARYCELPGIDHHVLERQTMDVLADEIQEFITGTRHRSEPVKDLVAGSQLRFADRGTHRLAGLPDEWRLYAVQ